MTSADTFTVTGMTCGHCVQAVTSEFSRLPGVSAVTVDLPTGTVTVHSARVVTLVDVAADAAGYELAS
jgi:copper chaperone CopZ